MLTIFEYAEASLHSGRINDLISLTHHAHRQLDNGSLLLTESKPPADINQVKFPERPIWLAPRFVPKRKLNDQDGVAAFFHAIGHIEFVAIYLAWDILYRFRGLPEQFYQDWLRIADEEAQHFELISARLQALGVNYGDLPAHGGLWDLAQLTANNLLARLALVPRCMEAHGLDVTPGLIGKFKQLQDADSVAILQRILTDEVGHVERGSFWFKYVCEQQNLEPEPEYQRLLAQYYQGGKPKGPFNREMRIIAGFTAAELDWLETQSL